MQSKYLLTQTAGTGDVFAAAGSARGFFTSGAEGEEGGRPPRRSASLHRAFSRFPTCRFSTAGAGRNQLSVTERMIPCFRPSQRRRRLSWLPCSSRARSSERQRSSWAKSVCKPTASPAPRSFRVRPAASTMSEVVGRLDGSTHTQVRGHSGDVDGIPAVRPLRFPLHTRGCARGGSKEGNYLEGNRPTSIRS